MSVEPVGRWYSMGELVRETGIPAATLRAWERRYGVPRPQRSSGKHRLYSERDLALIRWLMDRQQEGMGISRAIAVWKQLEARGDVPVTRPDLAVTAPETGHPIGELRATWIDACLDYDRRLAETVLAQAFALYPQEQVCTEILQAGLAGIGDLWVAGRASVQQEHFASVIATHQVERLIAATPPPWRGVRILVASPPEEQHVFALLLLVLLLRRRGWDVLFLGANVPVEQLDATVAATAPGLAVLAAYRRATATRLMEMAETLGRLGVEVTYGGPVFNADPSFRSRVRGRFLGEKLPEALGAIEGYVSIRGDASLDAQHDGQEPVR